MGLLTKADVLQGQFSKDGSPWVNIAHQSTIDLDSLQYSKDGSPWYGVEQDGSTLKISTISYNSLSKVATILKASIVKIANVTP